MSDSNLKDLGKSDTVKSDDSDKYRIIPKIELTTTSFDNYTLNKMTEDERKDTKKSDFTKLEDLFVNPKDEARIEAEKNYRRRRESILRVPDKNNNMTKSFDFLSVDTETNHFQPYTIPLKSPDSQTPLKSGLMSSKSQPNILRDMDEPTNLQYHISKMFNHAFTDAVYTPRESWLATVFNIYHAIILYLSFFLECYSTQLRTQDSESEKKKWRIVSLIFTIQLCIYFLAELILYPIRKRRHLAILEATTRNNQKDGKGEIISYKDVKVTKNLFKLYKGFVNIPHTMVFLGCLPFFVEELFPKCRLNNINHYGLISFLLMSCRLYTCLSIFYYLRNRISKFFHIIIRAARESIYEIISVIVLYFMVMIFCSRVIFYADLSKCTLDENSQNWKRQYKNGTINENSEPCELQSNLDAFWYTFMTMTTLGFGDQIVNTYFGKIMATIAFGATPVLYSLPSIVITTKMIQLIIHDTRNAATKDVAKKHKKRFFNMGLLLTGGVGKGFPRLTKKNHNKQDKSTKDKNNKNNNTDENDKNGKEKLKNNEKSNKLNLIGKYKNKEKGKGKDESRGMSKLRKNIIPLKDNSSSDSDSDSDNDNKKDNKKKTIILNVPENKKDGASYSSSIYPLINNNNNNSNTNPSESNTSNNYSNSNSNSNDNSTENITNNENENNQNIISDSNRLCESPEIKEEDDTEEKEEKKLEPPKITYESPKDFNESDFKKSIINENKDFLTTSNLTSSTTIKKFHKDSPTSSGKPLTSIFENPESGGATPSDASSSNVNLSGSNPQLPPKLKPHKVTTFKALPLSPGNSSFSETENESTIFDYNAYKKNASNKNYIVSMLKQHYQTCLDEIDYVKKREKTLNSLKSGFEKGIMALQTM